VKSRSRFLLFVILAVLLVVALDRAAIRLLDKEHHQTSAAVDEPEKTKKHQNRVKMPAHGKSWVIPIYPAGDLPVAKPVVIPKKQEPPSKSVKRDSHKKAQPHKKPKQDLPRLVTSMREGDFPVLEVGYEAIGFAGYLDVIERVGHFFLITNTENGTEIGSEISLKSRIVYQHRIDLAKLAVKRPHLVSDSMIRERLSGFSLPDNVLTDSIILVFSKPFDDLLWDTIVSALSSKNLSLNEISRIDGGYVKERQDIFLLIRSAEKRETGEEVLLNRRLRISLG
jgi:hypothetical protein